MSSRQISIAVDAMGGENSPLKVLKGIEIFKNEVQNAELKLFGEKELIISTIKKHKPLIAYSVYHRREGFYEDIAEIMRLFAGYNWFFRLHSFQTSFDFRCHQ